MRMRGSPGDKSKLRQTMQVVKKRERVAPPNAGVRHSAPPEDGGVSEEPEGNRVWAVVERFNAAWLRGEPERAVDVFAEDAVMVAPGLTARIEGREAIVQSVVRYVQQATTKSFDVVDAMIDVMGETAVVTYTFDVEYVVGGGDAVRERGQETLVLHELSDGWKIRWRAQVPLAM